jgi:hypothetical protein
MPKSRLKREYVTKERNYGRFTFVIDARTRYFRAWYGKE